LYGATQLTAVRKEEPAAFAITGFNLAVIELFWPDGRDYDLNVGKDGEYVGWFFRYREQLNDGTLWNQLFWLEDDISNGPAYEFCVFDRTRTPTPDSNYPEGNFSLDIHSYSYGGLGPSPVTVTLYPVRVGAGAGYDPSIGKDDMLRLKELGEKRKQSFDVVVTAYNPQGELGQKLGTIEFPGFRLMQA
jgi:hypothetical protein